MILLFTSFLAGALSVLAPCVVAFVPVVVARTGQSNRRPWIVIASLALSVIVFSVLLKSTTLFIDIPPRVWSIISGVIIIVFGAITIYPKLWERMSLKLGLMLSAQKQFSHAASKQGMWGDIIVGASLGPIFSACSPTYALIVATILPVRFFEGLVYLLLYVAGLVLLLSLIAVFGRRLTSRMGWGINPESRFHKVLGIVLVVTGIAIASGLDKVLLAFLVEQGLFDWQIYLESGLMSR